MSRPTAAAPDERQRRATDWAPALFAKVLPPGVPAPWVRITKAHFVTAQKSAEVTVEMRDGSVGICRVWRYADAPDAVALRWVQCIHDWEWDGTHWVAWQRGGHVPLSPQLSFWEGAPTKACITSNN